MKKQNMVKLIKKQFCTNNTEYRKILMMIFIIILFACISVVISESVVIRNCSTFSPEFSITNVKINQLPIKTGSNISIDFDIKSLIGLDEGTIQITVKYGFLSVSCWAFKNFCFDICQGIKDGTITCSVNGVTYRKCPINSGNVQVRNFPFQIPDVLLFLPQIEVTVIAEAYDQSRKLIGCIKADNVPVIN